MDCMQGMKEFPDNYFDLAIVDPPYGINCTSFGALRKYKTDTEWDKSVPDNSYFKELFRVSKNQIIWGGNYYNLPPAKCFLIWDKKQPEGVSFASCEFAWTSFEKGVAKTFYYSPFSDTDKRIHATQKPVALYEWILNRYAKDGDIILDTHVGSASSLIACHRTNHKFVGFELDEEYYKKSSERLKNETNQMTIYNLL